MLSSMIILIFMFYFAVGDGNLLLKSLKTPSLEKGYIPGWKMVVLDRSRISFCVISQYQFAESEAGT